MDTLSLVRRCHLLPGRGPQPTPGTRPFPPMQGRVSTGLVRVCLPLSGQELGLETLKNKAGGRSFYAVGTEGRLCSLFLCVGRRGQSWPTPHG